MAPALDAGVIQDDARQHVFWMQRLIDPSILRNDLFADYFASQAPPGYVLLYRVLLLLVDPQTASKLLPPVLGLAAAAFTFLLAARLYPSQPAAFLASVIGSWYVWQYDDLATGSPRAFLLPLTTILLYGLVAGWRWWLLVGVVALQAALYPSAAALGVVLVWVRLVRLDRWPPRLSLDRQAWLGAIGAGIAALLLLAPAVLGGSEFGPTVTAAVAREMPEFGPNGRNAFFVPDAYEYWIVSYRSGFDLRVSDPVTGGIPIFYELLALAMLLPAAALVRRGWPAGMAGQTAPLAPVALLVIQVITASMALFLAAHLLLFRLYLPARFVAWSVPLGLSLAAGVGLAALLTSIARRVAGNRAELLVGATSVLLACGLAVYPARYDGNFVRDRMPAVTEYLNSLPVDSLVVGVPTETDSVPAFSGRRVLTNREYALAYHLGYYAQVKERTLAVINAYYSDSPRALTDLADRYGVDVFLVNRAAFAPETVADAWAGSFAPYSSLASERVARGRQFALLELVRRCGVVTDGDVTAIPVACIAAQR